MLITIDFDGDNPLFTVVPLGPVYASRRQIRRSRRVLLGVQQTPVVRR
jgi:hypothetical protein